jgi:hypothetical protein
MNCQSMRVLLASIILIACVMTVDAESAARRWSVAVCGPVPHPLHPLWCCEEIQAVCVNIHMAE